MTSQNPNPKTELNVYEERFYKLMRLIKIQRMMQEGKVTHKKLPDNGPV
jgi:hypothetical protein